MELVEYIEPAEKIEAFNSIFLTLSDNPELAETLFNAMEERMTKAKKRLAKNEQIGKRLTELSCFGESNNGAEFTEFTERVSEYEKCIEANGVKRLPYERHPISGPVTEYPENCRKPYEAA